MPSYLGIILGLMSLGTGIYLVAGTKENDPYIKSKKGVGIFLIILGTILFMIGALYEETYDPTNPAFLQAQAPLESALENNTQGNGPVNQVVNTSGPVTVVAPNGSTQVGTPNAAAGPVPVVAPNGSTQVGTPNAAAGPVPVVAPTVNVNNNAAAAAAKKAANNAAAAAKKAANNAAAAAAAANAGQPAVQSAVVGPAAVPRRKFLGLI